VVIDPEGIVFRATVRARVHSEMVCDRCEHVRLSRRLIRDVAASVSLLSDSADLGPRRDWLEVLIRDPALMASSKGGIRW